MNSMDVHYALLRDVAEALSEEGMFAATFRDYASKTLEGNERMSGMVRVVARKLSRSA